MTGKKNKIEPQIRPSQVTRTFGPGSIYDNEQDSMVVMGLDYWRPESFKIISDPVLLMSLAENFPNVHDLVSTSSYNDPENPGNIPIRSFPRWGFCPVCKKLVDGRNGRTWKGMICDSVECTKEAEKENLVLKILVDLKVYILVILGKLGDGDLGHFFGGDMVILAIFGW